LLLKSGTFMANLSGNWLGTYWQLGMATRFEVTLIHSGNTLSGNILDDGSLGEAQLSGEVIGRSIQFTKRYLTQSHYSIIYTGTLSESEDFMQGQWRIGSSNLGGINSGQWEARRGGLDLMVSWKARLAEPVGGSKS
jgi:hypothetical protein